ncbi:SRPBCC domain-containing protein [Spirillospora sp. NPDC047279]|uniref:SRPBCC family protein n=1 Tax=Spirillospora sp. NPDC047279 TaxID=3155478 RepID=UPI003409D02B
MPLEVAWPDLSDRPLRVVSERHMNGSAQGLYLAWTEQIHMWFAEPGTVLMRPEVNTPYFFETFHDGVRHPHYGRFLGLEPARRVIQTWVSGDGGTEGAETVVTVELTPAERGTELRLTHAGFPNADARDRHLGAWPQVLARLDEVVTVRSP